MRSWCFGPVLLMLATSAAAQPAAPPPDRTARDERPPARSWRAPPGPVQDGRLGLPLTGNLQFGVGRFSVVELPRPRTHTEPISRMADVPRRHRGIAAVGLSLRF
jgi:hypothetical protein